MTSRAVLLPATGDPFTLLFCLKFWKERWEDEVDKIYVNLNSEYFPKEVINELLARLSDEPKIHIIYHPAPTRPHGQGIKELVQVCQEDYVMLLENDAYIYKNNVVDRWFKKVESGEYDVVGSPRGSCTKELYDWEVKTFNLDVSGYGDVGPNYWPNFFIIKRENLLKTDLNFDSKEFPKGWERFMEDNAGDTFVWMSIQLHRMGLKFFNIPQHKASPTEFEDKENKQGNWYPPFQPMDYIHAGSLSSGWGGYMDDKPLPEMTEANKLEFENRCAWWTIACQDIEGFTKFHDDYLNGIARLIVRAGLNARNIDKKISLYKGIMGL